MAQRSFGIERFRSYLVLAATVGMIAVNWLASAGRVNGVTPDVISAMYTTSMTPAGYAFTIWGLIYAGLIAFSIYQLFPANIARYQSIRSLYILSCAFNCAWIFFWHSNQITLCLAIIMALAVTLFLINYLLRAPAVAAETWLVKAPFGIYLGWVMAATLVNVMVAFRFLEMEISGSPTLAALLLLLAAALGVLLRIKYANYFAPLAIAWALTGIAVKQSGQTLVVTAAAVGVIACLIASASFVMNLNDHSRE